MTDCFWLWACELRCFRLQKRMNQNNRFWIDALNTDWTSVDGIDSSSDRGAVWVCCNVGTQWLQLSVAAAAAAVLTQSPGHHLHKFCYYYLQTYTAAHRYLEKTHLHWSVPLFERVWGKLCVILLCHKLRQDIDWRSNFLSSTKHIINIYWSIFIAIFAWYTIWTVITWLLTVGGGPAAGQSKVTRDD